MYHQRIVQLNLPKADAIDIRFSNVTCKMKMGYFKAYKDILKGVDGWFKSGELTAIMGPSGAGKSTLLNTLTGYTPTNMTGKIEYLGKNNNYSWKEFRKQTCYIQQDDHLNPLFTTSEIMWMATNLKIGDSLNAKAKQILIDDILDSLDLSKTKKTRCSRLSGGQKKRLSIALELVDNPTVIFLDEPTTGLDSLSSLQCITILQSVARAGRTVVCTIHQPSAALYEMFDNVYLIANGHCMYEGSAINTVEYFAHLGLVCPQYHNPADYMIEVVSGEYGDFHDTIAKEMKSGERSWRSASKEKTGMYPQSEKKLYQDEMKATIPVNPPSEIGRFFILFNRCTIQLYRDWTVTYLKLLLHTFVGIMLGLIYTKSGSDGGKTLTNAGYLIVSLTYICYTSMMPAVLKFPSEIHILRKERFNNWYQLRTLYFATMLSNFPLHILFPMVYISISYILSEQPLECERYLMFLLISILMSLLAESFGIFLGTLVNPINGTFLGAISICVMLLFAGFFTLFSHMPKIMYYLSYVSYLRYAFHALMHTTYGFGRETLPCISMYYCHYRTPSVLLKEFQMNDGRYWVDVVILVFDYVLLRVVTYCTLKKKLAGP